MSHASSSWRAALRQPVQDFDCSKMPVPLRLTSTVKERKAQNEERRCYDGQSMMAKGVTHCSCVLA